MNRVSLKVDSAHTPEGFVLDLYHTGDFGTVVFSIISGWALREPIEPPRPLSLRAWRRMPQGEPQEIRLPIPHQALEDALVRVLESGLGSLREFLVTIHDDYLQRGEPNDVAK